MQIKTNQSSKKPSNTDLVRRWLEMTLPIIAGLILLPYLFLFLGLIYTEAFHSIQTQTLVCIVAVQGLSVIVTPIITAWITMKRISQQLHELAYALTKPTNKIWDAAFANDEWISMEKQQDDVGLVARQIRAAFLGKIANDSTGIKESETFEGTKNDSVSKYSSLFALHVKETNTQAF